MSDATPTTETPTSEAPAPRTVESIEADAARVRDDLAETIDELAHRLDVPARAKERVTDLGERTAAAAHQAAAKLPAPVRNASGRVVGAVAGATAAAVAALVAWRRRRR